MEVLHAGHLCQKGKAILLKATSSKETPFLKTVYSKYIIKYIININVYF